MKWNKNDGNVIAIVDYDSYLSLDSCEVHNVEWEEFLKQFEESRNKKPNTFIMNLLYEVGIGEILTIELNNNRRIKAKVLDIFKEGENTVLVTTDF